MSHLPTSAHEEFSTVLIFDKEGTLGEKLAKRLIYKHLVVFISAFSDSDFKDENSSDKSGTCFNRESNSDKKLFLN